MYISKLPKKPHSRLTNIDTYKVVCEDPRKYIRAVKSFKSTNEFVHVALGVITKFHTRNKHIVIKVHETNSLFTRKEIDIAERLLPCKYAIKFICHYDCIDDKKRWMCASDGKTLWSI